MTPEQRKEGYACDVTYVTNSEIGFDFLRDNLAVVSGTRQLLLMDGTMHLAPIRGTRRLAVMSVSTLLSAPAW